MVFLDSLQGNQAPDIQKFSDKLYEWSDQAFYHLGLIANYSPGVGLLDLTQQGFGTLNPSNRAQPTPDSRLPLPNGRGGEGLRPQTLYAKNLIIQLFKVKDIGGYENRNIHGTSTKSDHSLGLALDVMVYYDRPLGQRVADYFVANYQQLKVKYVIWYDQIWTSYGSRGLYWRHYTPPGGGSGRTLQHQDHVHISFLP